MAIADDDSTLAQLAVVKTRRVVMIVLKQRKVKGLRVGGVYSTIYTINLV